MSGHWYTPEEFPILETQVLAESGYVHLLCARRPMDVRFSLGCVKAIGDELDRLVADPRSILTMLGHPRNTLE